MNTRVSKAGSVSKVLTNAKDLVNARKVSQAFQKSKSESTSNAHFSLLDYTQVSGAMQVQEPYLQTRETGIVLIHPLVGGKDGSNDVLDVLLGSVKPSTPTSSVKPLTRNADVFDFLLNASQPPTPTKIRLELILDARKSSPALASKFMSTWKELVNHKWTSLL